MALEPAPDHEPISSSVLSNRVRFVFGLVLVTIGAGVFAVAFRVSLTAVYQTFYGADNIVDAIAMLPRWLRLAVPTAAAAVAGSIARFRRPRAQGVSNVMEAIALGRVQLSLRATASRAASSWVAIAGGLSIGREGPLIEVGGALGAVVGRIVKTPLNETRVLIGAGTAAGFAAAYNTPFAASLFVLETMAGVAAPELLLPVMAATVGAAGITRATVGPGASRAAAVARHPGRVARRSDRHLAACRRGERVRTAESHCGFRGSR